MEEKMRAHTEGLGNEKQIKKERKDEIWNANTKDRKRYAGK